MRVIAGSARSLPLRTIEGTDTRPTQDRIKETLFNMLQSDIPGCKFLDLYSGSGAIGIEALSRGAAKAVLVENSKKAVECIKDNLTFTKLADKADVMEMDVLSAINRLKGKDVFSIVYMDPPYSNDYERDVLAALRNSVIIDDVHKVYSMEEWLGLIRYSKMLITNSYHGMIMAILFHIPFVIDIENGNGLGMNDRFYTLLNRLGLVDRIADNNLKELILNGQIDWDDVDKRLSVFRNEGEIFLRFE